VPRGNAGAVIQWQLHEVPSCAVKFNFTWHEHTSSPLLFVSLEPSRVQLVGAHFQRCDHGNATLLLPLRVALYILPIPKGKVVAQPEAQPLTMSKPSDRPSSPGMQSGTKRASDGRAGAEDIDAGCALPDPAARGLGGALWFELVGHTTLDPARAPPPPRRAFTPDYPHIPSRQTPRRCAESQPGTGS
jgi:hypothetical protein